MQSFNVENRSISNNSLQFSSIWPIDKILSGPITLRQSGTGSDGYEMVLCIPQSSSFTRTSASNYLVSYPHTHRKSLTPL